MTAPSTPSPRRLSRGGAFAFVALLFVLFMSASSAPSPLYVVYQHEWHFSATTLTTVFAVYVVGLIGSLLVLGALSDHVGRRPVLVAMIGLELVALALFVAADDVALLMVARFVQGVATGAAISALSAALVDLNPPHAPHRAGVLNGTAPPFGLALGALGCGVLVQYAPHPTRLVYLLLIAGLAAGGLLVRLLPETAPRRPGAARSLQPRLGVAPRLRADLLALVPILIASWALGALYLSLGPSVAAGPFHLTNHVAGGLVVALLCAPAAVTGFALRAWSPQPALRFGAALLLTGTAIALIGVEAGSVGVAAVGTVVAGVGFGSSSLASFGTLARLAEPAERGELFAVAYVISYLSFSIPAVIAGLTATHIGLHDTTVGYALAVIALCVVALVEPLLRERRRPAVNAARARSSSPSVTPPNPTTSPASSVERQ